MDMTSNIFFLKAGFLPRPWQFQGTFSKTNDERRPNQKQTISWRRSPTVTLCDHKMAQEPLKEPSRLKIVPQEG